MVSVEEMQHYLERANQVAQNKDWYILAERTLDLLKAICRSEAALLYQVTAADPAQPGTGTPDDRQMPWIGCPQGLPSAWWAALRKKLLQPALFRGAHPRWIDRDTVNAEPVIAQAFHNLSSLQNLLILPLKNTKNLPGGVMLFNSDIQRLELAELITSRMATEIEKASELETSRQRETRLMSLNDILGQLGANLNPDEVLRMFIERARHFLQVEAVSLFLIDESSGELVLQMASQADENIQVEKMRIPAGSGIIGKVVQTGETLLVEDVKSDQRHYTQVDLNSGFHTRSILAVPLRTRPINLGQGRGTTRERIIGGIEAINKIGGSFKAEDIELLEILAQGASTISMVAQLYADANNLFFDVIQALIGAIDAKDPYTAVHSQRVSDFSAEIARELGLSDEEIYHIRLGSLFHDVGKLGISDAILSKPGSLDPQEIARMRKHPQIGERIMGKVRHLGEELPALSDHHERLDGSGYPDGLQGDQIPLISRIVAVADVFEAMTSDQPYRPGRSVEEVLEHLRKNETSQFDAACVEALIRACQNGRINAREEGPHP